MKTTLQTLLLLAAAFGTGAVAQDNPPQPPPPGQAPGLPPEPPRRPDAPSRPEGDRPRGEERRRPDGDRPPGGESRRGPAAGESPRRDGEPRGEGGPRSFPTQPEAPQRLRPYLGVVTSPAPAAVSAQAGLPEGFGIVVDEVLPDSPAKAAGIERYDVLTKFEDQKLVNSEQLAALVAATSKDSTVAITLVRKGQEQKVSVKVAEKMLPDRQPMDGRSPLPDLRSLWNRYGDAARRSVEPGGPLAERAQDASRKAQEMAREFQRRMQEFQEKVEQWRKNPNEKFPEAPKFPNLSPTPPPPSGPLPGDVLREMRPGGAPAVQHSEHGATTTWSTANANVTIKDEAGEIEVRSENGRRMVVAKDAKGAVIFNGPIDTEEQRRELPEGVRRKLGQIEMRTRIEHRDPPREVTRPAEPRAGDVQ
jgi:hypothetical protein